MESHLFPVTGRSDAAPVDHQGLNLHEKPILITSGVKSREGDRSEQVDKVSTFLHFAQRATFPPDFLHPGEIGAVRAAGSIRRFLSPGLE